MKKRLGFVSNSSSSSFCILGVTTDKIDKAVSLVDGTDYDDRCVNGLRYERWIAEYEGGGAIGISPHKMDDDLTVAKNKEVVANKINDCFNTSFTKDDMSFIVDGGYNG